MDLYLSGQTLGLSISDNPDRRTYGFASIHQRTFMYEIARTLYRFGASIAYGGDLRNEGFTLSSLRELVDQQFREVDDHSQSIHSYLAWPLYCKKEGSDQGDVRVEDEFLGLAEFHKLPPPQSFSGDPSKFLPPSSIENRFHWFGSLTSMRKTMTADIDARIIMGGKVDGYIGRYPGILEELLFATASSLPVYIVGAFGGCAGEIAKLLKGEDSAQLSQDTQYLHSMYVRTVSFSETKLIETREPQDKSRIAFRVFVEDAVDYHLLTEYFRCLGISGLNNGLEPDENEILFTSPFLDEIIPLIVTGLSRVQARLESRVCEQQNGQSSKAEEAFLKASERVHLTTSALVEDPPPILACTADELLQIEERFAQDVCREYQEQRLSVLRDLGSSNFPPLQDIKDPRSQLSLDLHAVNSWVVAGQGNPVHEFLRAIAEHCPTAKEKAIAALPEDQSLEDLVKEGESETVELKSGLLINATGQREQKMKENVVKAVAGFLNSDSGGTLVIGVKDDGTVLGIDREYQAANAQKASWDGYELTLSSILSQRLKIPNPDRYYKIERHVHGEHHVCLVRASPASKPVYVDDRVFRRSGNRTVELKGPHLVDFAKSRSDESGD